MHLHHEAALLPAETANDRMKRASAAWLPRSLVVAVLVHFAILSFWPRMTTADVRTVREGELLIIPPAPDLPPPPEQLARPAAPVIGNLEISTDITIPPTVDRAWSAEQLAPPVRAERNELDSFEAFVPSMLAPRLLNAGEVERELRRRYPPLLRDAGIGGQVDVHLWLDEKGTVLKAEIARGSGHAGLDEAALRVVDVMRLSPAENRGRPARVIVTLPVRFDVK